MLIVNYNATCFAYVITHTIEEVLRYIWAISPNLVYAQRSICWDSGQIYSIFLLRFLIHIITQFYYFPTNILIEQLIEHHVSSKIKKGDIKRLFNKIKLPVGLCHHVK